jgi:hypothetical protein
MARDDHPARARERRFVAMMKGAEWDLILTPRQRHVRAHEM